MRAKRKVFRVAATDADRYSGRRTKCAAECALRANMGGIAEASKLLSQYFLQIRAKAFFVRQGKETPYENEKLPA